MTGGGDTMTGGGDTMTGGGDTMTGGGDTMTGGGDTMTGGGDTMTGTFIDIRTRVRKTFPDFRRCNALRTFPDVCRKYHVCTRVLCHLAAIGNAANRARRRVPRLLHQ